MASIGQAEAARLSGKNPSTIHRAMKSGKLSYTVNGAGERRIDLGELERVFGPVRRTDAHATESASTHGPDLATLQRLVDAHERTIADLRARLDSETEERRKLIAILTGPTRVPWWRRWWR